jgi:tRNA pseudouridine32 synthase/23S rRNA pseudouridine746 synthase
MKPAHFILKTTVDSLAPVSVCDFLAGKTGLSKMKVKDAMIKGAVRVKRKNRMQRLRRAKALLSRGDVVEFHYDEELLSLEPPRATLLKDMGRYSVWLKPAGLLSQGTDYGDHCSILRQAEVSLGPGREVFLVHRLDREASGLVLIAHTREAAGRLSDLFREDRIRKTYTAEVLGDMSARGPAGVIDIAIDGKPAVTEYELISYDPPSDTSMLRLHIPTGRKHQIRRHLDMIGHPVIGDPRYGTGNKNTSGMKLKAASLEFTCPFTGRELIFEVPETAPGKCP